MRRSATRTIEIEAPAARVLASLARPENLPDWRRVMMGEDSDASAIDPIPGPLADPIWVEVDNNRGTVDYFWRTDAGLEVAAARVISVDGGAQVVVTCFEPPKECFTCVGLEERAAAVEMDLYLLKALLEERAGGHRAGAWH